jgi:hypothetical protein
MCMRACIYIYTYTYNLNIPNTAGQCFFADGERTLGAREFHRTFA